MSRVARRHAAHEFPGSIADDLRLARELGGLAEAGEQQLAGTLTALGLGEPQPSEIDHARRSLTSLVQASLSRVFVEHPLRRADSPTQGTRRNQPWQAVAATSLTELLLASSGARGSVVDVREDVATRFALSAVTVKRHEDRLIDFLIGPRVHSRLTATHRAGRGSLADSRAGAADGLSTSDPLWDHLGASETELAEALFRNARIPGDGFDAQEMGALEPSRASTGMVTYALAMTPGISDEQVAELYEEIVEWISPGGVLPRRHGSTVESTWTESQCLLALSARPHLLAGRPEPIRLADSLARQQRDGGWAYRNGDGAQLHPVWTFYPLLALNRATRAEWLSGLRYRDAADRAARHVAAVLDTGISATDRLIALAVLQLATSGSNAATWKELQANQTELLASMVTAADASTLRHVLISDDRQPLWHARINPALLYLHARRALGPSHSFTLALVERLLAEYDAVNQGWSNSVSSSAKPYTWTTAIALRSCQVIRSDISAGTISWPLEFGRP